MTIPTRPERREWARDAAKALKLTASTRTVLEYLAFRSGSPKGKVYGRSLDVLRVDIEEVQGKISKRTLVTALQTLSDEGLITINRQGQTPSEYIPDFAKVAVARVAIPVSVEPESCNSDKPLLTVATPVSEPAPDDTPQSCNNCTPELQPLHPKHAIPDTTANCITEKKQKKELWEGNSGVQQEKGGDEREVSGDYSFQPSAGNKAFPLINPPDHDNARFPYPGGLTQGYLDALKEVADLKGRTLEHQMFLIFLSGLDKNTPTSGVEETIALKIRPLWREAAALRGIPVEWLVTEYASFAAYKGLKREKARRNRKVKA